MKKVILFLFIISVILISVPVLAEEIIDDFRVEIKINFDATIDVSEKITYNFGEAEKHDIFREIPIKYKARGNNYNLRISEITVTDNQGKPYNFIVSQKGEYKKIKIGDADKNITGDKVYIINYKIKRAINFSGDRDELYWNATGNEWPVKIKQIKASIIFPQAILENGLTADCYIGALGGIDSCISKRYNYSGPDMVNKVIFIHDTLNPGEGISASISFPKGVINEPSRFYLILEIIKNNLILFLSVAVFLILFYLWRKRPGKI